MAPLFLLSETSAGYGLFQVKDKKLLTSGNVRERCSTIDKICQEVQFNQFKKWSSAVEAISELDSLIDGKIPPILAQLLDETKDKMKKASIVVEDKMLGNALQKLPGFNITAITGAPGTPEGEIFRSIREHITTLIPDVDEAGFKTMSLGLSHSLSRHKLKFSPDKVDVMIIHAVYLLDELDKELNVFMMRVKEWYGWHFPELGKILNDNVAYAKVVTVGGMRDNLVKTDLSEILPEEIEQAVRAAAEVSMGCEIAEEDLHNVHLLAEYVIMYSDYRTQLSSYLDSRMKAIAPNLTAIIGPLIGARLIAHTGSLMNLAKAPGSTIQILGAEKALFRALKTKHSTPKYGLIYHSSLVGQATGRNKGKMARQVASKAALGARVDALSEYEDVDEKTVDDDIRSTLGLAARTKLELSLSRLEHKPLSKINPASATNGTSTVGKWDVSEARKYNIDADGLTGNEDAAAAEQAVVPAAKKEKKDKKEKKEKKEKAAEPAEAKTNGASGPAKLTEEEYEKYAEAAGISVSKFKRKYERGDVEMGDDGKPIVHSKKELKKLRKEAEKKEAEKKEADESAPSKRKRDEDGETPKKKKKKHAA